jgi:Caspase domain
MATLADPAGSWAVLLGVSSYRTLPALPSVAANLIRLRELLTDPTIWGLPEDQCLVPKLTSDDPLGAAMTALKEAIGRATDTVLVYYAGHGLADPSTGALYLSLPGGESLDDSYRALAFEQIRARLSAPGVALRRVVLVDCCYSALALDGQMGAAVDTSLATLSEVDGAYVCTACAETETALAPPDETYTAFTGELIGVLANGIPDGPELLDLNTLYSHLTDMLAKAGRALPQQRNRNRIGQLAFARNRARSRSTSEYSGPAPVTALASPPAVERAQLLRRAGDFRAAEAVLRGAATTESAALRDRVRALRRANRHGEAARLLRGQQG